MNQSTFESYTKPLTRVLSDDHKRSIDNILHIFLSFSDLSTREYRHKSKMIYACKRRENWYRKWEHYEEWKIILITKTSVMKEYFKYVFLRMRTCTEFHIEKGFRRNRIQRKMKGVLELIAKITNIIRSVIMLSCKNPLHECRV